MNLVLQDSLHADDVLDQKVALHAVGEVPAGEDLSAGAGPRPFVVQHGWSSMLVREIYVTGKQCPMPGDGASTIVHDVLAPVGEHVSVRIGEVVGHVAVDVPGSGIKSPDTAIGVPLRAGRGFDLRHVKRALLKIHSPTGSQDKTVYRMMRVGRVDSMQDS